MLWYKQVFLTVYFRCKLCSVTKPAYVTNICLLTIIKIHVKITETQCERESGTSIMQATEEVHY